MEFVNSAIYQNQVGIYKITNTINNKCYIGQTTEAFKRRYWHHLWCLQHKSHFNEQLQRDWDEYGSDYFIFSVVHVLQCDENIDRLEKHYIALYCSTEAQYGYNRSTGGKSTGGGQFFSVDTRQSVGVKNRQHMLGRKHSDETKAKMRASSQHLSPSAETRQKISAYMSNRVVTEETRQKLKMLNQGSQSSLAKLTEADVEQIQQLLMHTVAINEIATQFNVSYSTISAIRNGRTWTHVCVPGWATYLQSRVV